MEYIILAIVFMPFILAVLFISGSILLKSILVLWADAFSIMGWEQPKKYLEYHSYI